MSDRMSCGCRGKRVEGGWQVTATAFDCPLDHPQGVFVSDYQAAHLRTTSGCESPDSSLDCPRCAALTRRVDDFEAEYKRRSQKWVDTVCHYRNLAIELGAKPERMLSQWDRDLAANHDPSDWDGWEDDTQELWQELETAERDLAQARQALARETELRRDAERHRESMKESYAALPYSDEWERFRELAGVVVRLVCVRDVAHVDDPEGARELDVAANELGYLLRLPEPEFESLWRDDAVAREALVERGTEQTDLGVAQSAPSEDSGGGSE